MISYKMLHLDLRAQHTPADVIILDVQVKTGS